MNFLVLRHSFVYEIKCIFIILTMKKRILYILRHPHNFMSLQSVYFIIICSKENVGGDYQNVYLIVFFKFYYK